MSKAALYSEPRGLHLLDQIAAVEGFEPTSALQRLKERAAQSYKATGLPTRHWENWRYTDLRLIEKENFTSLIAGKEIPGEENEVLVINGHLQEGLARDGLRVMTLAQAVSENPALVETCLQDLPDFSEHPLVALNAAALGRGVVLHATRSAAPISLHYKTQGDVFANVLVLVVLEEGVELELNERYSSQGQSLLNHTNIIHVAKGAKLTHYRLQEEGTEAAHIAYTSLNIGAGGSFKGYALNLGGALSRHEIRADFKGKDAVCALEGIYLVQNRQLCDTTIEISHTQPSCVSRQNYRGVIDDQARAVFQGKIHVSRLAQKTDGYQLNHALLLSETAEVDCKPELEIYADDVKCSHGATVGQVDDAALFYLRSRGIPENAARALLVEGFLNEILETVENEAVRALWTQRVGVWLRDRF